MPEPTELLALYDAVVRPAEAVPGGPRVHAQTDGPVVRLVGGRRGFVAAPVDLGLDVAGVTALVERQRDVFAALGEPVEWKTRAHDLPGDLPAVLLAAGFVAEPTETVLVAAVADLATDVRPPAGVVVRQIDPPHHLAGQLVFVAEAEGVVISTGRLELLPSGGFGSLWGGETVERWRHRGVYRALVSTRAGVAAAQGLRYLHVDASEDSRPILERLGFTAVTTTTPYVWSPPT
jgi:hypothetical protein